MYIEGIGEVQIVSRNSIRPRTIDGNEKSSSTKARERLDLIIRAEVGISYQEMLGGDYGDSRKRC